MNSVENRYGSLLRTAICLIAVGLVGRAPVAAADFVWVEGEDASQRSMRSHSWYDSVVTENLSGGRWLSHFAPQGPPEATFNVSIDRAGDYHFWVRCNPVAGARIEYRLNDGTWTDLDMSRAVEQVNIAVDGQPDMRFIAWVNAGLVRWESGDHRVSFRFRSVNQYHGAIDCFVFSRPPFQPRGTLRPGARTGLAEPGYFAWEPDADAFEDTALVDLRHLNETVAGESGRVRAAGNGFVLGDGRPVKFWATNAGPGIWDLDHQSHVYLARRLAKSGVNLVRLHGPIYGQRDPTVNLQRLDQLHHLVFALKQEGIYTHLSFYFPLWFRLDGDQHPFMLLFFDRELQSLYAQWADQLLNTDNPYTQLPLGRDPAVAMLELVNEDSHFFWTFDRKNMPAARWRELQTLYGNWLAAKHGSLEQAVAAWGGARDEADDLAEGRVELYSAWHMTRDGLQAHPHRQARMRDQVEFLAHNMRALYQKGRDHLRQRADYDGLIVCGNWHVADPAVLDALERYCYTVGDVIDHHGYFDHGHEGEAAGYSVRPGQRFTSHSALHLQHPNPLPYVETDGYPHIVSEIGWPAPNRYRAEFPFLAAAYGSLQGCDGIYSFALGGAGWDQQMNKFPVSTPVTLGCFPAMALVFRRGYVQEAPTVVMDHLAVEDLFSLRGTSVYVDPAYDRFRAPGEATTSAPRPAPAAIDPATFYVGRVARSFGGRREGSFQHDLSSRIDHANKRLRSVTDELTLDYGSGVSMINTPKAQGAAGFLGPAGPINLADVTLTMRNDYGTVTVVALDDQPIAQSRSLLIQCMTVEQFYGFKSSGDGNRSGTIEHVGSAPCGVERFQVTVTIRPSSRSPITVRACDEHGYPRETPVRVEKTSQGITIELDPQSPYHVFECR